MRIEIAEQCANFKDFRKVAGFIATEPYPIAPVVRVERRSHGNGPMPWKR